MLKNFRIQEFKPTCLHVKSGRAIQIVVLASWGPTT